MSSKSKTVLSIIIVNYNGCSYTQGCIDSILASHSKNAEIVIVDNGSTDTSVSMLKSYGKKIRLVLLDKNYGPAYARNRGVEQARGDVLCFLDNDTVVDPSWANTALDAFAKNKKLGVIQCKLMLKREPDKIDYVGEYLGTNGFLIQRTPAGTLDTGQFEEEAYILAAKSAGMFIRRQAFEKAGGFDDDYFIYVEETDLGWRCWLAGYTCMYIPQSIVLHEFGTSTVILSSSQNSYNAKFHGSKNYICTLLKNLSAYSAIRMVPIHVMLWCGLAAYSLIRGEYKHALWIVKGILWNITHLQDTLKKRARVQNMRTLDDTTLFKKVVRQKPFRYYLSKAVVKHKVGNAESF